MLSHPRAPHLTVLTGGLAWYSRVPRMIEGFSDEGVREVHADLVEALNDPATSDRAFSAASAAMSAVENELSRRRAKAVPR